MAAPYPSSSLSLPTNLSMSTPESSPQGTKEYCHSNLSSFPLYSKHISACISFCLCQEGCSNRHYLAQRAEGAHPLAQKLFQISQNPKAPRHPCQ